MPISVPTMYLLNNVRQIRTPLANAQNLSKLLSYRMFFYTFFGGSIILGNTDVNNIRLLEEEFKYEI